ncbi:hypothetical protein Q8G48_28970, partial [Klebsiella pneumoniae]|uniref:hypothetical protein n=1 Tax=Klebsiella pneumoniae TaxID=573 RepID=UPI0030137699
MYPFDMIEHFKVLFEKQARHERYETTKAWVHCTMAERSPLGPHILKMNGYIINLKVIDFP